MKTKIFTLLLTLILWPCGVRAEISTDIDPSEEKQEQTAPSGTFLTTGSSENSITITFTDVSQSSNANGIEIAYAAGTTANAPTSDWTTATPSSSGRVYSATIEGLSPGTPYVFFVRYKGNDNYEPSSPVASTFAFYTNPKITTESLPDAHTGVEYSAQLEAVVAEGTAVSWSVMTGSSLPAGLTLSSDGTISGTPTTAGQSSVTIKVAILGSLGEEKASNMKQFLITISKSEEPEPTPEPEPEPEEPEAPIIPDYPDYYNIMVEECEGATVETSTNVVREGTSLTFTVDVAEGYTAEDMVVKYKRSIFNYWETATPEEDGTYRIRNIYTDIYIMVEGVTEEAPTGIEDIEGAKVYTKEGCIYVYTPTEEQVTVISMNGAIVKNEKQTGLKQYSGLQRGIYIICIGDERVKVRN